MAPNNNNNNNYPRRRATPLWRRVTMRLQMIVRMHLKPAASAAVTIGVALTRLLLPLPHAHISGD